MAGSITVRTELLYRKDEFGRFVSQFNKAVTDALEDTVREGIAYAERLAPMGDPARRKKGDIPLKGSIRGGYDTGRRAAYWGSISNHAKYVIGGTMSHPIVGYLSFPWAKSRYPDGKFYWRRYDQRNWDSSGAVVNHPGTHPYDFLGDSFELAKRNYKANLAAAYRRHGLNG